MKSRLCLLKEILCVVLIADKSPIQNGKPQETLELLAGVGDRPGSDSRDLRGIHWDVVLHHDVAQEGDR